MRLEIGFYVITFFGALTVGHYSGIIGDYWKIVACDESFTDDYNIKVIRKINMDKKPNMDGWNLTKAGIQYIEKLR